MTLLAFTLRSWTSLELSFSLISLLLAFYYFVPESPRWMVKNGRGKEAREGLR